MRYQWLRNFLAQNLSVRILLLSLGLATVLVLAVMLMVSQVFITESKQRLINEKQLKISQIAQLIDDNLLIRRVALSEFAMMLEEDGALKPVSRIQQMLDDRVFLHRYFNGGLLVLDADAVGLVDSPIITNRVGTRYDDRDHVKWVKQHLEAYISHPFVGRRLHTPIISINAPILNKSGVLLGYMIGISLLNDDFMMHELAQRFTRTHDSIYLLDFKNDMFVSSTEPDYVFSPFDQLEYNDVIQQVQQGVTVGVSVGFDGDPALFVSEPLAHIDWHLLALNPMDAVMQPVYSLLHKLIWLVLGVLLIALPIVYVLMKKQLKPIGDACRQIDQALTKPFPLHPLNLTSDDELSHLLRGFNQLIEHQNQQHQVLQQAQQHADQASQLKSRFLATMGHEVRTPVVGILGLTDLALMSKNDTDKQHDYLVKVQSSGQAMLRLLNNMLDFSRIEAKQVTINPYPFALSSLLNQLTSQFEATLYTKDIQFHLNVDDDLLPVYCADSSRLLQVLTNLVGNAIKFTHQGFVKLSISPLERKADKQAWLVFEVLDSGMGMTDQQQSRLFQAFSQADDFIARDYGGTGLGLVISQDLVLLMGGEPIEVHSRLSRGSRFSFALPLDRCSDAQLASYRAQVEEAAELAAVNLDDVRLKGRILVAEDNQINQHVVGELLIKLGLDVTFVADGEAAVELMQAESFDLVLMDRHMPKLNGYLATERIRRFDVFTPIIALTASSSDEKPEQLARLGLNDLIEKPIDFLHTATTVAKWLNQPVRLLPLEPMPFEAKYQQDEILDIQKGLQLMNGRQEFYAKMLGAFRVTVSADFLLIKRRFERVLIKHEQDAAAWDALFRECHNFIGVCKGLALVQLVADLSEIEKLIKQRRAPSSEEWRNCQQTINETCLMIDQSVAALLIPPRRTPARNQVVIHGI